MNRHGFTLIEMLVVIAIIAILAAILFPVFHAARAKARYTRDVSNLRQIMMAIHMYADDHDELPPPGDAAGTDVPDWFIHQTLPYVRNQQLYYDSEKEHVRYFSFYTYPWGVAIDHEGDFLHPDTYQAFFMGPDKEWNLEALHETNRDNLWVDVENLRIMDFRKVQQALRSGAGEP